MAVGPWTRGRRSKGATSTAGFAFVSRDSCGTNYASSRRYTVRSWLRRSSRPGTTPRTTALPVRPFRFLSTHGFQSTGTVIVCASSPCAPQPRIVPAGSVRSRRSRAMRIRREEAQDIPKIHALNVAAFGSTVEANIVDVLRSDAPGVVSLVADDNGEVVGHIMFSPVRVAGAPDLRAMALAPMAVIPQRQRMGIGSELVRAGLEECRRSGVAAVFVVGHSWYYPRFGFSPASACG